MITTDTREYRSFEFRSKETEEENEDGGMILEGRAVVFNQPEVMFEYDGIQYKEQIDRNAFAGAKIDDVILNMNHDGQALARTRNKTLRLDFSDEGLDIEADMTKSQASRDAYEAVKNGLLDRMSFAFTVAEEDGDEYDEETHTRTIWKIDRLYDVSLVNFPAYEATSVSARSYFEAKAEAEHRAAEAAKEREEKRAALSEQLKELEAIDALSEHAAEIRTELSADDADLEKMAEKVADLEARKAEIRREAEERAKEAEQVAKGLVGKTKEEHKEKEKMTNMEIRDSKEYIEAYANYCKTGDDKECRALLTENVNGGTLPVPTFVGEIIAETFKTSEILNRVRKNYARGNFKQPFEYSAPIATAHTEGGNAVDEEELLIGYVDMKAQTWKKWVGISDENLDLLTGEAYLRYIYEEISRGIVKAREKAVCDAILAAPQTATATAPAVAKTGSAAGAITDIVDALALLGDAAEDIVVIVSKSDYATYRGLQMAANYGVDPFDGLEVIKCNYATVPIVGDLKGVMENFTRGEEDVQIKYDDKTRMKQDLVDVLGRLPSAIEVVGNLYFAKVSA